MLAFSLGCPFGTVLALSLSGFLAGSSWGWPSIFYVFGILGLVWSVLWFLLIEDTPSSHPRISVSEKQAILSALGGEVSNARHKQAVPYKSIFTSMPFWAVLVAHTGQNWGFYTMLTQLPSYMKHVLRLNIKQVKHFSWK